MAPGGPVTHEKCLAGGAPNLGTEMDNMVEAGRGRHAIRVADDRWWPYVTCHQGEPVIPVSGFVHHQPAAVLVGDHRSVLTEATMRGEPGMDVGQ